MKAKEESTMLEEPAKRDIEITDKNKVVSLFRFIQELNKLKQKAVLNVKDYPWFFPPLLAAG